MDRTTERHLLRLLTRESGAAEAARLRARIASDPELQEAYDRLEQRWSGLTAPPPPAVPAGFASGVIERARAEGPEFGWDWTVAPRWARAVAVAALVAGAALGSGLIAGLPARAATTETASMGELTEALAEPGLAEWYAVSFEDEEPAADPTAESAQ